MSIDIALNQRGEIVIPLADDYWQFYGLQRDPFSKSKSNETFYLSPRWEEYFDLLNYLCRSHNVLVTVTGVKGCGKTAFLQRFTSQVDDAMTVCYMQGTDNLSALSTLQTMARIFNLSTTASDTSEDQLDNYLHGLQTITKPCLLLIDDAEKLPHETLRVLFYFIKQQSEAQMNLHVVLFGLPALFTRLSQLVEQRAERDLLHNLELNAFSPEETNGYIKQRLQQAGLPAGMPLGKMLLANIHKQSGGIPIKINKAARQALIDQMEQDRFEEVKDFLQTQRARILGAGLVIFLLVVLAITFSNGSHYPHLSAVSSASGTSTAKSDQSTIVISENIEPNKPIPNSAVKLVPITEKPTTAASINVAENTPVSPQLVSALSATPVNIAPDSSKTIAQATIVAPSSTATIQAPAAIVPASTKTIDTAAASTASSQPQTVMATNMVKEEGKVKAGTTLPVVQPLFSSSKTTSTAIATATPAQLTAVRENRIAAIAPAKPTTAIAPTAPQAVTTNPVAINSDTNMQLKLVAINDTPVSPVAATPKIAVASNQTVPVSSPPAPAKKASVTKVAPVAMNTKAENTEIAAVSTSTSEITTESATPKIPAKAISSPIAENDLSAANPNHFTLQISASDDAAGLNEFVRAHDLSDTTIYHVARDGRNYYVLVYGQFASAHAAEAAGERLPVAVQQRHPWPRSFGTLQEMLVKDSTYKPAPMAHNSTASGKSSKSAASKASSTQDISVPQIS